jgi:hypothetical protein
MDQMPVYFTMSLKRTLELIGTKTIHVHTSTNDNKRATVAVTVTGTGMVLPLMVIFKGKPNGVVHVYVRQKLLKPYILRVFWLTDYKLFHTIFD